MKFHHYGVPTTEKLADEKHLPHLKMFVSGYGRNEVGIEKMRFEPDAQFPEIVKTKPHLVFEVENLNSAIKNKKVIIEHNSPSKGVLVAFIDVDGVPIEFIQVDRAIAEEGI